MQMPCVLASQKTYRRADSVVGQLWAMELQMPVKSTVPTYLPMSKALTIILGKDHKVHYFSGLNAPADKTVAVPELKTTTFAADGIRQVVLARQRQQPGLVVLIKPSEDSKYKDMVDILDELRSLRADLASSSRRSSPPPFDDE